MKIFARRFLALVVGAGVLVGTSVVLAPVASAAGTISASATPATSMVALTAPTNVTVTRKAAKPNDFTVSWSAPTAGTANKYTVTIFADGQQTVQIVPGSASSLDVTGKSLMSIYSIRVGARTTAGDGDDSAQITLEPALPGAPVDVTGVPSAVGGGIALSWGAPGRNSFSPIDHYHVDVINRVTGVKTSGDVAKTTAAFTALDQGGSYLAAVTAVTKDGSGLTETAEVGGPVPTTPRGVTAVRDPLDATKVVISWDVPSYPGAAAVTGYRVASGATQALDFKPVTGSGSAVLPLAVDAAGMFAVQAVNAKGASVSSSQVFVPTLVKTLTPTSAYPVSVTVNGRVVTASFVGRLGAAADAKMILRLAPAAGYTYREEQVTDNGSDPSATLTNVPPGKYTFAVSAYNPATKTETQILEQEVVVNDSTTSETATQASFSAGIGLWTGVYPSPGLPKVVTSNEVVFDGSTSMAITATVNSVGNNVSVGTNGQRGVPVTAGQQLVVSAQGLTTTLPSRWNVGISWWDASKKQISIVRTPQVGGTVGAWQPSANTFTAPAGAVLATAFVEVGDLLAGQTAYIDGIALRSTIVAPHPETPADWLVVRGSALISGSSVKMSVPGETNVLDPFVQDKDITVNSTGTLISGQGYGIWVRASWTAATQMSGYSLQLDPGYGGEFILRHWYNGSECSVPLARTKFPAGFLAFAPHQLSVTVKGDALNATVDSGTALSVPSLSAVLATESCKFPAPTGTSIGFRKWDSSVAELTATVRGTA